MAPQAACTAPEKSAFGVVAGNASKRPGVLRKAAVFSRERPQHDVDAREDQAAAKDTGRIERIDRHGGPRVDDDAGARRDLARGNRPPACRDQRCPPVGAQFAGRFVAVDDATGFRRSGKPFDGQPPARQLTLDAHARRFAGDVDADRPCRSLEVLPLADGERSDVLIGDGTFRGPSTRTTQRPFHSAVADVDDENLGHGQVWSLSGSGS